MKFDPAEHPHRRYNALTGEWILVSPHRAKRPWQGQSESDSQDQLPGYDENCYLCPRNTRISGEENPDYKHTFVFSNDFAALQTDTPEVLFSCGLLKLQAEQGLSRVICYSPDHGLTLPELHIDDIKKIVDCWASQAQELGEKFVWVQIFENKGTMMGCSMPHPHGQIWAQQHLPSIVEKEAKMQSAYFSEKNQALLLDYVMQEEKEKERVVLINKHWLVVVPYWASWPFETLLLPRFSVRFLHELQEDARMDLAAILQELTIRYDNLFNTSFAYSMGWHGAPYDEEEHHEWLLHAHFYPPLLRSASIKKYMVGYEMMAEPQRDITAEQAAQKLRSVSAIHYKLNRGELEK